MGISNDEIIEGFKRQDFDRRMQVADAIVSRALDHWPQEITLDEAAQIEKRAVSLVSAIKFLNF